MKKILFIHHAAGWGGASNCLINLINSLDRSKYKSEVLLLKDSIVAAKLAENGITYKVAESIFYKRYYHFFAHSEAGYVKWFQIYSFITLSILWILSRYIFAKKELAKYEFDIVHLNSSVLTDWLAPAKEKGKVVIHIREPFRNGELDFLHYFFKSKMSKYADQIIAISQDNARRIGIPAKTEVIYDYCEIPTNLPSESSYTSKKVLYLGGSSTSKGFYTLVDALDYLDKNVMVYFGGHYATSIKSHNILIKILKIVFSNEKKRNAAIQKIKNHPNAILIGLINNVQDYLDEVCCLVSPFSVPHFACPVFEAHMHKKPAIGSDVEGMDEIIEHEKTGLIILKNNSKALATAINQLTADSHKIKRFGKEGYNIAIQKFTPRNIQQFERLYDQLSHEN
jgi:glycosyltransferase involved in cell wall biosynthesis